MRKTYPKIDYHVPLHSENFYHIYNRANGKDMLFRTDADRRFFLNQYRKYLSPFLQTFVYQLLGNHFHFVVKINSISEILSFLESLPQKELTKPHHKFLETPTDLLEAHPVLENQFLRLFTSYAMRYNRIYDRKGNLFHRPFKRVSVNSERHFGNLVCYVHANCRKHGLQRDFVSYPWSSYQAILSNRPTQVSRQFVLDWFGGIDAFVQFHQRDQNVDVIADWIIEEE